MSTSALLQLGFCNHIRREEAIRAKQEPAVAAAEFQVRLIGLLGRPRGVSVSVGALISVVVVPLWLSSGNQSLGEGGIFAGGQMI